jgi:hypothetical protein
VTLFPKQRFAVALLCNEDNAVMGGMARVNPDELAYRIADIYLADVLEPAKISSITAALEPKRIKLSDAALSDKTGLYSISGVNYPVRMTVKHGALMLRSYYGDGFDLELVPISDKGFVLRGTVPFEFIPANAGRSKQWRVGEGKDQRLWDEVTLQLSPAALRSYTGSFHSDELGLTYTLATADAGLLVKGTYFDGTEVTIVPFSKDVFVGDLVGIVKFSRDASGTISGFSVNRDPVRGVRFDRTKTP